jgi:pyruvate,water dikinase
VLISVNSIIIILENWSNLAMRYVLWLNETNPGDENRVGEKAAVLAELIRLGLEVPLGFCLSSEAYQDILTAHGMMAKISARLDAIDVGDPAQLEQAAEEIRRWICDVPFADDVAQEIQSSLDIMHSKFFAVRSSRTLTEVPDQASSGLHQAHLGVPMRQVLDAIRKCWATPWNSRAIYFRYRKKIGNDRVSIAVIVQTMIHSTAAGVLFTASPSGSRVDEMHIDGIWGLGEAVNAARWKPDHYVLDNATGAIREKSIATKTVMQVVAPHGGLQTIGVPDEKQTMGCLTDAQIMSLATIGKKAQAHFGASQDIGWCSLDDRIFVLQSRALGKK